MNAPLPTTAEFLAPRLARPVAVFGGGVSGQGVRALLATFGVKTLKLKIRIVDRTFNFSNEIESPEFTLQQVLIRC